MLDALILNEAVYGLQFSRFFRGIGSRIFQSISDRGGLLDQFLSDRVRDDVAEYVFGFKTKSFKDFERNAISALLSLFFKDGKLRYVRFIVLFFIANELIGAFFYGIFSEVIPEMVLREDMLDNGAVPLKNSIYIITANISLIFDYLSLILTKRIFLDRKVYFPMSAFWIFVDLFFSSGIYWIAAYIVLTASSQLASGWLLPTSQLFAISLATSALSASLISLLQVFVLIFGSLLRLIMIITRINRIFALHSNAIILPFTSIGIFFTILFAIYAGIEW